MKKRMKKLTGWLCALLVISMTVFSPVLTGQAAKKPTGTVKNPTLNVRSEASTSSSIVCKLSKGTKVSIMEAVTGDDGLKWYNVFFTHNSSAEEGYVRADLISTSANISAGGSSSGGSTGGDNSSGTTTTTTKKYTTNTNAVVRSIASTNGDKKGTAPKGTEVTVVKEKTGDDGRVWIKCRFNNGGQTIEGYIRSDLLGNATTNTTTTRTVTQDTNARSTAEANGDIKSWVPAGTVVTVISQKTGDDGKTWVKCSFLKDGQNIVGYIRLERMSGGSTGSTSGSSSSTSESGIKYVKNANVNIRSKATTSSSIMVTIPKGSKVGVRESVTGTDGKKWYKVAFTLNGKEKEGYIRSDLVTDSGSSSGTGSASAGAGSTKTIRPNVAIIRSTASTNGDIRTRIPKGTPVTIIKEKTGDDGMKWYKVSFKDNGVSKEGYVRGDLVQ